MGYDYLDLSRAVAYIYRHVFRVPVQGDVHDAGSDLQIGDLQSFEAFWQSRIIQIDPLG